MKTINCILLVLSLSALAAGRQNSAPESMAIPESVTKLFKTTGLDRLYNFSAHLKPQSMSADFDGDGKADIAILVRQKSSGKIGE
jgi:hypothetical protein